MSENERLKELKDYDRWREHGEQATWFGVSTSDMTRNDLLALIGWAGEEIARAQEAHGRCLSVLGKPRSLGGKREG